MESTKTVPFYWVDAFTSQVFGGNPAAVCLLDQPIEETKMQALAKEFNLSETAFTWVENGQRHLKWFTPVAEVRLCGHATLATAAALWDHSGASSKDTLSFETLSGELKATRVEGKIRLVFPARPPRECSQPQGLAQALGVPAESILFCGRDADDLLVQVDSEERVLDLSPDFGTLVRVDVRGVIVTAESSNSERDFVSRFFAPRVGVDEDPVTGSAHCCLTPFWAQRTGRARLRAEQLSKRRGQLEVKLQGDRVHLLGSSAILVKGEVILSS